MFLFAMAPSPFQKGVFFKKISCPKDSFFVFLRIDRVKEDGVGQNENGAVAGP